MQSVVAWAFPTSAPGKERCCLVATQSGTPVGMIIAQFASRPPIYTTERMVEIDSAVVHPDFRRKGVFKGMLSLLEEKASFEGSRRFILSCITEMKMPSMPT
ncbi:GNAT family N-acetyltransferase [Desulfonatronospira sp.]|uniref:GNAT family N-acetyltransferase n=1 Tax=Desulfonatronospira sp. TaxID=1962951 RepID=UPI00345A6426